MYNRYNPHCGELYHHGILGQKWGVRRYQNEDGSLTEEGKRRYHSYKDSKGRTRYIKRSKEQIKRYDKEQAYWKSNIGQAVKSLITDDDFNELVNSYQSGEDANGNEFTYDKFERELKKLINKKAPKYAKNTDFYNQVSKWAF